MKHILDNGVTVITEKQDHVRGVSLGIWIRGGSCADGEHSGIAHYAEHMAFKGTKTRSTNDTAKAFDALGGDVNAFTGKEMTCYYCRVLDTNLYKGFDLLCDIVLNPAYTEADTENERKVILEEIAMCEDSPDDLSVSKLYENVWSSSPLGREILGTANTVKKITPKHLMDNLKSRYTGENIVISACGSLDEERFVKCCEEAFGSLESGERAASHFGTVYTPSVVLTEKPIEQNHICIGFAGIPKRDERRQTMSLFSTVLGGSMSSRLFQSVREQSGLAYTVCSQSTANMDAGLFSIYTALSPKSEGKALELIRKELDSIKKYGITCEELERAKEQFRFDIILDLDSIGAKMKFNARNEIYGLDGLNADVLLCKINAVTVDDVKDIANEILDYGKISFSVVGKPKKKEFYKGFFE